MGVQIFYGNMGDAQKLAGGVPIKYILKRSRHVRLSILVKSFVNILMAGISASSLWKTWKVLPSRLALNINKIDQNWGCLCFLKQKKKFSSFLVITHKLKQACNKHFKADAQQKWKKSPKKSPKVWKVCFFHFLSFLR